MVQRIGLMAAALGLAGAAFVAGAAAPPREAVSAPDKPELKFGQKTGYFNMAAVMRDYNRAKTSVSRLNDRRNRMSANLVGLKAMFTEIQVTGQQAQAARQTAVIERCQRDLRPALVGRKVLAHVDDMPAEMPDRRLRQDRRRGTDLGEQHQRIVRGFQRRKAAPVRPGGARKLPCVEGDGRVGVDGVEMKMMKARWHGGLSGGRLHC